MKEIHSNFLILSNSYQPFCVDVFPGHQHRVKSCKLLPVVDFKFIISVTIIFKDNFKA